MATNKHATIRYHALDQCFSNLGRKYFIDDLIEVCSNAIYQYTGKFEGIKRRQIYEDIKFMESEQGWSIPLEHHKDGKRVYYRYSDKSFSIKNQSINETEAKQLKEALSVLTRFKGMPQFEWMEEMLIRVESAFHLAGADKPSVAFEQNPYLKGLNFFSELFNAIQNKTVLVVQYRSFKQKSATSITIHPYFLKQYNSRWFLFGHNKQQRLISNLPLDRIIDIKETREKYLENKEVDFEEYFEDVVGVTVKTDQKPVKVTLEVNRQLWPYIETKPLHGSQKVISKQEKSVTIGISVIINYELSALIFSLGEAVTVISPPELREVIKNKADALFNNYL